MPNLRAPLNFIIYSFPPSICYRPKVVFSGCRKYYVKPSLYWEASFFSAFLAVKSLTSVSAIFVSVCGLLGEQF